MDPDEILIPMAVFEELLGLPDSSYSIAYDISTRRTQDNLLHGWNSHRCEC